MFAHWGYPPWFATLIGILELIGAVGLLIPRTTRYAVLWLSVIMCGAGYTHLANHEGMQLLRPILFLSVLWTIWLLRGTDG
jgi:putative oxidoreductase